MARFVWTTGELAWTIEAKDHDEAYRMVIANRLRSAEGETEAGRVEAAQRGFRKNDDLIEIEGDLEEAPYTGELPEQEDS